VAMDKIMDRVEAWHKAGRNHEVITVDQPADGPYLLMRLAKTDPARHIQALESLRWTCGENSDSGIGVANIDTQGGVHPDQFWHDYTLGNVRTDLFGRIWRNDHDPVLRELRQSPRPVKGRCAECRFLSLCGGGFRVRAWQKFKDPCAEDPGCYLDPAEISGEAVPAL